MAEIFKQKNAWLKYDEAGKKSVMDFCEGYRKFISDNKTERECAASIIEKAKKKGYKDLTKVKSVKAGDKLFFNKFDKAVALFIIGKKSLADGMKILGAHIDSPRIDLKQNPLYEDSEMALFDTHYYGGIKKYQWVTLPMAIHGVICKKDGTVVKVNIGDKPGDPVVGITDILIHLGSKQLEKSGAKVVEGEDLNVTVGSIPLDDEEKSAVKRNVLEILEKNYGLTERDFISCELEVVPAGEARDFGLDSSMIMGYGQDDRVCAYTSAEAIFEAKAGDRTQVCLLVDKEEIGSVGATGMHSRFFEDCVAEILDKMGEYKEIDVRRAMSNSVMLSSDVSAAYDPNYSDVFEKKNTAFFGYGSVLNKYTGARGKSGSNDASPEYIAKLRAAFDKNDVTFQTAELGRVDAGGGGTIAYIMGNYGMNVIDSGVAVLNMHAPWEITSKIDIYETYRSYKVFLKEL
ncbi:MAG: aminopeptidase [Lachnospiraceae bacterium]|nr:aminopeptidase [Lachnospiraceae bacterium]